jgi:hypothetical protein
MNPCAAAEKNQRVFRLELFDDKCAARAGITSARDITAVGKAASCAKLHPPPESAPKRPT